MIHKDTEKEFDKLNDDGVFMTVHGHPYSKNIKAFISSHFIDKRILEEKIEGMKKEPMSVTESPNSEVLIKGYEQALEDLKQSLLNKKKKE